jgi:hypothetical protein
MTASAPLSPAGLLSLLRQSPVIHTPEGQKLASILAKSSNCNEVNVRVKTAAKAAAKKRLPYDGQKLHVLHQSARYALAKGTIPTELNAAQRTEALKMFGVSLVPPKAVVQHMVQQTSALLPKTPQQIMEELGAQKAHVAALKQQAQSTDEAVRVNAMQQLPAALKVLASLVAAAKVKHIEAMRGFNKYNEVTVKPHQRKAKMANVKKQLIVTKKELAATKRAINKLKPGALRQSYYTKAEDQAAQIKVLKQRYLLLRQGKDLVRVRKIVAGRIPRKPLPQTSNQPIALDPVLARIMIRYLAARIPRHPGEGRQHFIFRLRMYFKRSLARFLRLREKGETPAAAAESAAVSTIVEDSAALESEVCAGGEAQDSAADAMDGIANEYSKDLELAATQLAPETAAHSGPGEFINPQVAQELQASVAEASDPALALAQAATSEAELMTGFEATPVVDETITIADVESMAPSPDGAQWYKNKYLLGGAAVAAAYLATR